ncbi:MAG: hypothetical protein KKF78_03465 [Candidatus Omnitrophica bacterium]|nr:hypothetical protein [Candidatus Omnitrophota bacterium]MBU1996197.1 hypothetical protein [Candidatus Omnitrophota bacterium]
MKRIIFVLIFVLAVTSTAFSEELYQYDDVNLITADIDFDGEEEKVESFIAYYGSKGLSVCVVKITDGADIIMNEVAVDYDHSCRLGFFDIRPVLASFITISEGSGAHGGHLHLLRYVSDVDDDGGHKYSLSVNARFTSNRPSFKALDIDGDGEKEIAEDWRDYETDPVGESIMHIYKFMDDGKWYKEKIYKTAIKKYLPVDFKQDESDIQSYIKINKENFLDFE